MELTYAELTTAGPVRDHNEDSVGFWKPDSLDEKRERGSIVVIADGLGGLQRGEVASRLAVDAALKIFREAKPGTAPQQLITEIFQAANLAVYDEGMKEHGRSRIATTLAVVILRHNTATIGNVGDSRVYLARRNEIRQLTTDHSYVAMQRKFGLINEADARTSENRSMLTRTIGQEPTIRIDVDDTNLLAGDRLILCTDGLHGCVADGEICDIVSRFNPSAAGRQLVALAEQRGTEDNVSVQVVQINAVEEVGSYRGVPVYHTPAAPSASTTEVQPGQTLDNRFLVTETISRSGMATIFKAQDLAHDKQYVAVKVPHLQFESDPGFFSRFEREEDIGLRLNHPFILKFIKVENKSRPYIVTEYLRGYTLAHLLTNVRPLPPRDALSIASRVTDALIYLHQNGIIHRDLKPQNIMICPDGTIRLMDFGIAGAAGKRITFAGFSPALGTPDFMAPEQVRGKRGDARTDIYSLGAILYEMLTGHAPYEGDNPLVVMNARLIGDPEAPRKHNPALTPQVEEIILHAMARDPNDRYASAAELKADLDSPELVTVTGRADRLQAATPMQSALRRYRSVILAIGLPLLVILGLIIWLIFHPPK